ncbi:MAG TPA: hypothetical protein VMT20_19275 [Terriglobia bacterium]|nr:hypothetical protein [Terriglobia bacterium]
MRFARVIFGLAGVYGLGLVLPMYFERARFESVAPPVVTHLELYYGFAGVTLAWQVAFLIIAAQPARCRLIMIPSILEKFSYGIAVLALGFQNRAAPVTMAFGTVDLVLGALFMVAYVRTASGADQQST